MSNQSGSVILGTLVGAAVGFAAGILLAPAKGSETREILMDKSGELKDTLNDATERAIASLNDLRESAEHTLRKESKEAKVQTKAKANETASAIKNA